MSFDIHSQPSKVCPTCGTRLNENAPRCLVCGRTFQLAETSNKTKAVRGPRMPEITLSLPIALGLIVLILTIGAGVVFAVLRSTDKIKLPTQTPLPTTTSTITPSPTATSTSTPQSTFTPLPPVEYTVKQGDYCSTIAAIFNISVQSIVIQNDLPADCGMLYVGQKLLVPQPTPTASPLPSPTLSEAESTEAACEKINYTVKENDTISLIAATYNVPMETIKTYNGLTGDIVWQGQTIIVPLCARRPTPGPTPTATLPPPYPAPNLLLPADGAAFMAMSDTITLQWASVGTLRQNEAYAVTIEDITEGQGRKLTEYVTDTKFIVPSNFRPTENMPHVLRWGVLPVRQTSTTTEGKPVWDAAGSASAQRVFTWWSSGQSTTPTPPQ